MEQVAMRVANSSLPVVQQCSEKMVASRCLAALCSTKSLVSLSGVGNGARLAAGRMEAVVAGTNFSGNQHAGDEVQFGVRQGASLVSHTARSYHLTALARAEPVSTPEVEGFLDTIKWDGNGLAVAIAQDVDTGAILMQGFVNRDAVSATLASCRATFFSRSRSQLWTKGETSSNFIQVEDVFLDCDGDSIIYLGKPHGPTCHTGAETCYFKSASERGLAKQVAPSATPLTTLYSLEATIAARKSESVSETAKSSWTKRLLTNQTLLCSKIREEAEELCKTVEENEGKQRTASEMADVLYHAMVLLAMQDVKMEEVLELLRARFSQSGVEEKASRQHKTAAAS